MQETKLTAQGLKDHLWEAMEDFKNGNLTRAELNSIVNAAGKIVQIAVLESMDSKAISNREDHKQLNYPVGRQAE